MTCVATKIMNDFNQEMQENTLTDAIKFGVVATGFAMGGFVGGACAYASVHATHRFVSATFKHMTIELEPRVPQTTEKCDLSDIEDWVVV